jgi:hypothetical protein
MTGREEIRVERADRLAGSVGRSIGIADRLAREEDRLAERGGRLAGSEERLVERVGRREAMFLYMIITEAVQGGDGCKL